jgi:hypothetical protein
MKNIDKQLKVISSFKLKVSVFLRFFQTY